MSLVSEARALDEQLRTLHARRDAVLAQRATLMAEWRELRALFDATGPGPEFKKLVARRKHLLQRVNEWRRRARELDVLVAGHRQVARLGRERRVARAGCISMARPGPVRSRGKPYG